MREHWQLWHYLWCPHWHDTDVVTVMSLALILMRRSWAGYCLSRLISLLCILPTWPQSCDRDVTWLVTSIGRHLSFSGLRHFRQWLADWNTDGTGGGQIVSEENMGHGAWQCQGPGSVMQTPGPVWDVVSRYWEETTWPPAHPGTSTQLWPGHRGGNIGSEERGAQWQQRGLRTQWSQWRD